ncbi:NAD-dependent epimerase/dehydratase family protein [Streptomyces sp. SBT349]|uniref:NAD-dependent epimerase/dehydratase family protein n=1 Tax=Streptomyces sp. SBT349 TaxID=1580539 RepID=UPI00066E819F|nr:NAD(P)-dependent oxidoreductase [Streptomyces sp. SBT349]
MNTGEHDPSRVIGPGDTVLVTGAAGTIGRTTVRVLREAGLRVVAADRRPDEEGSGAERTLVGDFRDPGFVAAALGGPDGPVDAVVHLAAIPAPGVVPEDQTLIQNVHGAYLVLDEAGRAGVRTAVAASSMSAYGYAWAGRDLSPPYVPVDEGQATVAIDSYALSKVMSEQVGAFVTRRWGLPCTLLRFPFVGEGPRLDAHLERVRHDPGSNRRELWAWLHTLDAAGSILAVLRSGLTGHRELNVAAPDSSSDIPTAQLFAQYHPTTELRPGIEEFGSSLDSSRATTLLGFTPHHGWRGTPEHSPAGT